MKYKIIVNPASGNRNTLRRWPEVSARIHELFKIPVEAEFTLGPGSGMTIARRALKSGATNIIVIGGDGTVSEALNGFFYKYKSINPNATLSFLASGTGSDLSRSFDIPNDLDEALIQIRDGKSKKVDVGKVSCKNENGRAINRYFLNMASFGIGGNVALGSNRFPILKAFGGRVSFYIHSFTAMLGYKNLAMKISVDGKDPIITKVRNAAVANGKFQGGGMYIAPFANISDGKLDLTILGDLSFLATISLTNHIYKKKAIDHPKIRYSSGKLIEVECEKPISIDVDGEEFGNLPATFQVLPKAVKIKV